MWITPHAGAIRSGTGTSGSPHSGEPRESRVFSLTINAGQGNDQIAFTSRTTSNQLGTDQVLVRSVRILFDGKVRACSFSLNYAEVQSATSRSPAAACELTGDANISGSTNGRGM